MVVGKKQKNFLDAQLQEKRNTFFMRNMQFFRNRVLKLLKNPSHIRWRMVGTHSFYYKQIQSKRFSNKKSFRPKKLAQIGGSDGVMWLKNHFPENSFWKMGWSVKKKGNNTFFYKKLWFWVGQEPETNYFLMSP